MNRPESPMFRAARWLTFGSAVSILLGIAYSQSLLALALVALLLSGEKLRLPPVQLPKPRSMVAVCGLQTPANSLFSVMVFWP